MLSRKAQKLYDAITARGGGIVDEYLIRDMTGLSHGSIVAARHELIDAGLLTLSKACRKMVYHLTGQLTRQKSEPAPRPAATPIATPVAAAPAPSAPPAASDLYTFSTMPHITGTYCDFDEWTDALMDALGDCLDISESLVEEGTYTVYAQDYDQEDTYHTEETEDGFVVN